MLGRIVTMVEEKDRDSEKTQDSIDGSAKTEAPTDIVCEVVNTYTYCNLLAKI